MRTGVASPEARFAWSTTASLLHLQCAFRRQPTHQCPADLLAFADPVPLLDLLEPGRQRGIQEKGVGLLRHAQYYRDLHRYSSTNTGRSAVHSGSIERIAGSARHCPEGTPREPCTGAQVEPDVIFLKVIAGTGWRPLDGASPFSGVARNGLIYRRHTGDRSGLSCCRVCSDDDAGPTSAPTGPSTAARARTGSRPCARRPSARPYATVPAATSAATQAAELVARDTGIDNHVDEALVDLDNGNAN